MMKFCLQNSNPIEILCLGSHCDDIEIGAGATLLKLFQNHNIGKVTWIVLASNEIRKGEAVKSAEQFLSDVDQKEIVIKSFRDGFFPYQGAEIKEYFELLKKETDPDLIFTHYRNDRHQDHRIISDLTWNTWRNHFILEYEIPKYDGDLGIPNFYVELNEQLIKKKNKIIVESFHSQNSKHWFDETAFSALPRLRGMESATEFAEAFYVRKFVM